MLLALDTGERFAFDLADGPAKLEWLHARPLPAVDAWMYTRSLDELGLSAGAISEDSQGSLLPLPNGAFRIDFGRGETAWTVGSTAAGPLRSLKVPKRDRCRRLQVQNLLVAGEASSALGATSLGDGRMMLVLTTNELWVASASEVQRVAVVGLSDFLVSAVALGADGTLYLGSEEGSLARGTLTGTTVNAALLGNCRPGITQLAVGPRGEVFAISLDSDAGTTQMVRLEGTDCVTVGDFPFSAAIDTRGGVVAPSERVAYGGHSSSPFVYAYDHGAVKREQPGELNELILALSDDGSGGLFVGTGRGSIIHRASGRWNRLFSFDSDEGITALIAIPGGLLFGTVSGAVGYYTQADGLCRSKDVSVPNRPVAVAPTQSGGWLFSGARPLGAGPTQIGIVHFAN